LKTKQRQREEKRGRGSGVQKSLLLYRFPGSAHLSIGTGRLVARCRREVMGGGLLQRGAEGGRELCVGRVGL